MSLETASRQSADDGGKSVMLRILLSVLNHRITPETIQRAAFPSRLWRGKVVRSDKTGMTEELVSGRRRIRSKTCGLWMHQE